MQIFLVEALEDYTGANTPDLTKVFSSYRKAIAYSQELMVKPYGYNYTEIRKMNVE